MARDVCFLLFLIDVEGNDAGRGRQGKVEFHAITSVIVVAKKTLQLY
jgi:hypothetical protein